MPFGNTHIVYVKLAARNWLGIKLTSVQALVILNLLFDDGIVYNNDEELENCLLTYNAYHKIKQCQ